LVDWKKDTWMYVLIAAILALISIFTPVASTDNFMGAGLDAYYWWGGAIAQLSEDFGPYADAGDWFGSNNATIWTLGITCMSIAILLFYGLHGMKGMEFKWDWLVVLLVGIALIVFPILMLVYDSTADTTVSFAPIGILISGIICVVVFILEKFMGD